MKRIVAIVLCLVMVLSGCSSFGNSVSEQEKSWIDQEQEMPKSESLGNAEVLDYVQNQVYQSVVSEIDTNQYFVENVEVRYISQEYIDELTANSQENIYFGYTLSELNEQFQGARYVFGVDEEGKTIVTEFQEYDDTFDQVIRNIAIGTGVILICVTVSVVSGGVGAPAVSMVFAGAAKTGTAMALSSATIGGSIAGAVTYSQTGDVEETLKQVVIEGSEEFKWGAIIGTVAGGTSAASALKGATLNGLSMNEAAQIQRESKWSLDTIKQMKSIEEYNVYKNANLTEKVLNGKKVLVREIDLEFVSELSDGSKVTNLQRMEKGLPPLDPTTGKAYQLHHIGQKSKGTLAILTEKEHQGNASILNTVGKESEINRKEFNKTRKAFWEAYARIVG